MIIPSTRVELLDSLRNRCRLLLHQVIKLPFTRAAKDELLQGRSVYSNPIYNKKGISANALVNHHVPKRHHQRPSLPFLSSACGDEALPVFMRGPFVHFFSEFLR